MSESEEKKIDYLEVDESIPGQNYVCLSFLSPESMIKDKEGFKVTKFLQSYCKENKLKFEEVYEQYKGFCYKHEDKLQRDFDEHNDFKYSLVRWVTGCLGILMLIRLSRSISRTLN